MLVRGPIGAGKTTLMRGLARRSPWSLYPLDTDAATSHHPSDPHGEHLEVEWPLDIDLVAINAQIILSRGLGLVADPGLFLNAGNVDRFLRRCRRTRRESEVALIRLRVSTPEAIERKRTLQPRYIRASHRGWRTLPIPGEIVIDTDGHSAAWVLREAIRQLDQRFGT